jgi:hypothetical protein
MKAILYIINTTAPIIITWTDTASLMFGLMTKGFATEEQIKANKGSKLIVASNLSKPKQTEVLAVGKQLSLNIDLTGKWEEEKGVSKDDLLSDKKIKSLKIPEDRIADYKRIVTKGVEFRNELKAFLNELKLPVAYGIYIGNKAVRKLSATNTVPEVIQDVAIEDIIEDVTEDTITE